MNQPVVNIALSGRVLVASCAECGAFVAGSHCIGALAIAARRHVCGIRKPPERALTESRLPSTTAGK